MVILFAYGFYKKSAELHFHAKVYGFWKRLNNEDISIDKQL